MQVTSHESRATYEHPLLSLLHVCNNLAGGLAGIAGLHELSRTAGAHASDGPVALLPGFPEETAPGAQEGVCWNRHAKRWVACIWLHGRNRHLGQFTDEIEAARAYDLKTYELFGEYAYLNFPEEIKNRS